MTLFVELNMLGITCVGAILLSQAWPATRAVRLRNALLVEPSTAADFDWAPPQFPPGFRNERLAPSATFAAVVKALGIDRIEGDWQKALALAGHLVERAEDKGAIRSDLDNAYRAIRDGYGYCADFARVYLALAHAAGLTARQWSFSFNGFGGHGHVVIEVYDRQRGKWLFIDVYNNFHAVDETTSEPLSALEFRDEILGRRSPAAMRPNGPGRPGYVHDLKAREYYGRGAREWYLLWGNDVFTYESHSLVKWTARASSGLGRLVATVLGVHPRIRILESDDNSAEVGSIMRLKRRLQWLMLAFAALVVAFALHLAGAAPFA